MKRAGDDSQKRVAFPIALFSEGASEFAELEQESEIHIVPTGKYTHWSGYEFEITPETIAELKRNFDNGARKDIPITAGHDNGMSGGELPAVGWFTGITDRGVKGLYGFVKWTQEGRRLLAEKAFKYFSAEIAFEYTDLETKQSYASLLVGGALTNKPFFKQLDLDPAFGFSDADKEVAATVLSLEVPEIITQFTESTMNIADILAKLAAGETLSADEIAFVKENEGELTDEQKTAAAGILADEATETDEEREQREGDENEAKGLNRDGSAKAAPAGEEGTQVDASEKGKTVTLSATEVATLRAQADEGAKAFAELKKAKDEKLVSGFLFSDSNKGGKFLVKSKGALEKFVATLSEVQRDQFTNIVAGMPALSSKLFSEIGENAGGASTAFAEISKKIEEYKTANPGVKYSDALQAVLKANPELETRYSEEQSEEAEGAE